MIMTKSLKYEDITGRLEKNKDIITIIGCNTCIRVGGAGGPEKMKELAMRLRKDGYKVKDGFMLPDACMEPYLATVKLSPEVNTVICLSCTAGSANVRRNYPGLKVIDTVDDIGLMIGDANKGVLKLQNPYKKYEHLKGNEYEMCSDGKLMPTKQLHVEA
mgnify:CR=1 FL=1